MIFPPPKQQPQNLYQLKPIADMTEEHLCNTITCYNPNLTAERKQQCKEELVRRWTRQVSAAVTRATPESIISSVTGE